MPVKSEICRHIEFVDLNVKDVGFSLISVNVPVCKVAKKAKSDAAMDLAPLHDKLDVEDLAGRRRREVEQLMVCGLFLKKKKSCQGFCPGGKPPKSGFVGW